MHLPPVRPRLRLPSVLIGVSLAVVGCTHPAKVTARPSHSPTPIAHRAPSLRMPLVATDNAADWPCDDNGTQAELDGCALKAWDAANKALNAEVRLLWANATDDTERRLLASAQSRWLASANAFCDWQVDVNRDGSVVGMTRPFCMAEQADRQRRVLREPRGVSEDG